MPTAPTLARPSPRDRTPVPRQALALVACGLGGLALVATADRILADPARVDVVVENPTDHEITVRVRAPGGEGAQSLGPVSPRSTKTIESVVDQGESWVFEYSSAGVPAAEVEAGRTDVESGAVTVPARAGEALESAGVAPRP